jgi:hypothetical protein
MTHRAPSAGRGDARNVLVRAGIAVTSLSVLTLLAAFRNGGEASPAAVPADVARRATLPVRYSLAPDGGWVALWTRTSSNELARVWAVSVDDGRVRTFDDLELAGDSIGWDDEGNLRVQVVDPARALSEMRWIDPDTGRVVDSTRDRERMRRELSDEPWASVQSRSLADGTTTFTVVRADGKDLLEVSGAEGTHCVVAERPGLVFHSTVSDDVVELTAVDLEHESERRFAQLAASSLLSWTPSPTGRGVLLLESGLERRARVIDSARGMLLHGPWRADEASWVEGAGGRYIALTRGPRHVVYDTLRDREVELVGHDDRWPRLIALEDGRFVLESELRIEVRDADLRLVRVLHDPAPSTH